MKFLLVFDSSLFGNCLEGLSVSELLTLKHSLKHLEFADKLHKNYTYALDVKCPETTQENCKQPSTMALVGEKM